MQILKQRPYAGQTDFESISSLVSLCETDGQLDDETAVSDLQRLLNAPSVDPRRDLSLWEDSQSRIVGFGMLLFPYETDKSEMHLWFYVHPSARGNNLKGQIVQWGKQRSRQIATHSGRPVQLCSIARAEAMVRVAWLERQQFQRDRAFITMARSLDQCASPQFPDGFQWRSVNGNRDARTWVELFNHSFIDHWNYHPLSLETFNAWQHRANYRSDLDLMAIAPSGIPAAFCRGQVDGDGGTGRIQLLGTRRGFRKMGLGRAMLLALMQQLQRLNLQTVKLSVDAQSPTGAMRLYEAMGFEAVQTWQLYRQTFASSAPNSV
jgi:mycothiol synthase